MPSAGVPAVSVVVPTVRGGRFLDEALDSVLAQTLADWELLVVCDGFEGDLPERFTADPRIRVLRQRNRGESVARNVGVRAARADVVAFVDDDDRMVPERLERQLALMSAHPEVALCHSQFRVIDATGAVVDSGYAADVQYEDLLRGEVQLLMPATAMRRSVLEEVGTFDSTMRTGQDLDVIFRIAREYRLGYVDEVLTEYRRHGANASGDPVQAGRILERILVSHRDWARKRGSAAHVEAAGTGIVRARHNTARGLIVAARSAWHGRHAGSAAASLWAASRLAPGEVARDLVGNRRAVAWARRSRRPAPSPR